VSKPRAQPETKARLASQPQEGEPVARAAVVGASGFAGALAASLAWSHPRIALEAVTSRSVRRRLNDLYPRYRVPLELEPFEPDRIAERADVAFVSYPHGEAGVVVADLRERGLRVVDLSADFRLHDLTLHERWYGPHTAPQLKPEAVFGLTELHRAEVAEAMLVANPGCYSTAALLALAPLARAGLIADAVVDAKSGVSGAGQAPTRTTHFVSVDENLTPYSIEGHRHAPEIAQELEALGCDAQITFVPHLAPLDQGLLASCYVTPARALSGSELRELFEDFYAHEPFIELTRVPPGVRDVRETNLCRIRATVEPQGGRVMVFAVIDNLWKGAAGQAIQNLNLMLGLDEATGLR
jgi:N-acetyl-gamma-glutamyl-phosphate reductase